MNRSASDLHSRQYHSTASAARALGVDRNQFRRYALTFVKADLEVRPGHFLYTPEQVVEVGAAIEKGVLMERGNEKRRETMKRVAAMRVRAKDSKTTK